MDRRVCRRFYTIPTFGLRNRMEGPGRDTYANTYIRAHISAYTGNFIRVLILKGQLIIDVNGLRTFRKNMKTNTTTSTKTRFYYSQQAINKINSI